MAIPEKRSENGSESPFEILNNLETIFNGAFLQDDDDDAVDEGNYFTSTIKSDKGLKTVCFRNGSEQTVR